MKTKNKHYVLNKIITLRKLALTDNLLGLILDSRIISLLKIVKYAIYHESSRLSCGMNC